MPSTSTLSPLHGHAAERLNTCHDCQGELRGPDGGYYTRLYDDGTTAYCAAICAQCKAKRRADSCTDRVEDGARRLRCYLPPRHRGNHKYQVEELDG